MRPDASAAETPLIGVDELMTVNDEGFDVADVGVAPLLVVGVISPTVLVAIKVAPSGGLQAQNFLGVIADRESVDVVVISVFAGVVDALTTKSSRILVP
jgi:hypothetical protein